jgi:glycosyltransferase involved in cell wall biosynthesis/dTDP-4-amino-4,6-dideoxygalactose transaminase
MIAPYQVPYGPKELRIALRGLARPFPDVGRAWFPAFRGSDVEVFPTRQGREAEYALLLALRASGCSRVGVPIFTHPVVWQTIAAAGMEPVFLDTDPITLGLSLADLRKKRDLLDCLILIHAFGYPADFDAVAQIMQGKPILEDCAHALGSSFRGRPLGSLGDGAFFTFLFSKSLRAGGGGCAVVRNRALAADVERLLGEDADESVLEGLAHAAANLFLALAYRQPFYSLLTAITSRRLYRRAANRMSYRVSPSLRMRRSDWAVVESRLKEWRADSERHADFWSEVRANLPPGWRVPPEPSYGEWNHWLLPIVPPDEDAARRGIASLRSRGVGARLIYLYSPEAGRAYGYRGDCPEAERLSRLVFLLPSHSGLAERERRRIVQSLSGPNEALFTVAHVTTIGLSLHFLRGQAAVLRKSGASLHAISSPDAESAVFRDEEGVPLHPIPMTRRITPLRDLVALWRVWRTLRRIRPQVVHAHTPKGGLLGMIAAFIERAPARVYHLRGISWLTASGPRRWLLRLADRTSCLLAHRVLAVSRSTREIAIEQGLCAPEKIKVLLSGSGQGVDTKRFTPAAESARLAARAAYGITADALVVGFLGRIVRDKGLGELAGAWRSLSAKESRLHLLLAGKPDPDDAPATALLEALQSDPRVHYVGHDWDTPRLYAAMDLVALPTYREGFPNVALEAAAMGLPIVASRVPGCTDAVVDGVTGTLVEPRDAVALADGLASYLADAGLRERHGKAGRGRVMAEFRREAILEAIVAEYRDLLGAGATGVLACAYSR